MRARAVCPAATGHVRGRFLLDVHRSIALYGAASGTSSGPGRGYARGKTLRALGNDTAARRVRRRTPLPAQAGQERGGVEDLGKG